MTRGFSTRPPELGDAAAIAELRNALHLVEIGSAFTDESEVRLELTDPDFAPASDALLVTDPSGGLVGSGSVFSNSPFTSIHMDNYVHPEWIGRGIGALLLGWSEGRAAEIATQAPAGERVVIHHGVWQDARPAERFFAEHGYGPVRYFRTMEVEMSEPPPEPSWPSRIEVRAMDAGTDDRAVYEADNEAFEDHWGHVPSSFESWKHDLLGAEGFDPTLCFIAMDGQAIAGVALCKVGVADNPEGGYVDSLGVKRPWRRRGIALALLQHCLAEFFRRGYRRVTLEVDSENPTGAMQLYERAGMHPIRQWAVFQKVLIAGPSASPDAPPIR
ncbi:MAG: GNAT family N-acetyltransferase [Actinomycetota bacterium]|nr:GNAT family N-acetyltransferase [Actinomycetota bacterium]